LTGSEVGFTYSNASVIVSPGRGDALEAVMVATVAVVVPFVLKKGMTSLSSHAKTVLRRSILMKGIIFFMVILFLNY